MKMAQGLTLYANHYHTLAQKEALDVKAGGVVITGGLTLSTEGLKVSGGVTLRDTGLVVSAGGVSVPSGSFEVNGGVSVWTGCMADTLKVTGGLSVSTDGLKVHSLTMYSGGLNTDKSGANLNIDGDITTGGTLAVAAGGMTLLYKGMHITGGLSVNTVGLKIAKGLTVTADGLTVADDGLTINYGNLYVTGGLSVATGGMKHGGGVTLNSDGIEVTGGVTVDTDGFKVTGGVTMLDSSLVVSAPMTIFSDGLHIQGGGLTVVDKMTVVTGGVHVTGGLTVHTVGGVITGGLTVQGSTYLVSGYSTPSDRNLKENITQIDNSLSKISRLKGVYFNWAENARSLYGNDEHRQLGLLAQDVMNVLPEAVSNIHGGKYLGVKYDGIIPLMIEALKEIDSKRLSDVRNFHEISLHDLKKRRDVLYKKMMALLSRINFLENSIAVTNAYTEKGEKITKICRRLYPS